MQPRVTRGYTRSQKYMSLGARSYTCIAISKCASSLCWLVVETRFYNKRVLYPSPPPPLLGSFSTWLALCLHVHVYGAPPKTVFTYLPIVLKGGDGPASVIWEGLCVFVCGDKCLYLGESGRQCTYSPFELHK